KGWPAAIIPPPNRTMSGSIVCIMQTAPTARYRAVSRIRRFASASPACAASSIVWAVRSSFANSPRNTEDSPRCNASIARAIRAARPLSRVLPVDDDVPRFGPVAVLALDDLAVVDDAAADARAQGEHHEAIRAPPGADPELAVSGGVGVVLQNSRLAQLLGES